MFQLFYPRRCFSCLTHDIEECYLCSPCAKDIRLINLPEVYEVQSDQYVDHYIFAYQYYGTLRKLITQLKFSHKMYVLRALQELIQPILIREATILRDIDVIVPMPTDRIRLSSRGFNHMMEICKIISHEIDKPIAHKFLKKRIFTIPQSGLKRQKRLDNLTYAFISENSRGHVLLVDDVYTTGRTIHHAAQVLKQSGCKSVTALLLAKA